MEETRHLGIIGEQYVLFKLAQLGIEAVKLPDIFDFDIYTTNNIRIEVKTSAIFNYNAKVVRGDRKYFYDIEGHQFHNYSPGKNKSGKRIQNHRDRECDYFIFICLNELLEIDKAYVVPKDIVGTRKQIRMYSTKDSRWEPYLDKWEQLFGIPNNCKICL